MALSFLAGLDHVVIAVRDLDAAARLWTGLGFTVSPRGTHSAHLGTANHTIMLGPDYIELIGVLQPTEHNAPTRALLAEREGLERLAFTSLDTARGIAELRARGVAMRGPVDFSRPVDLPGGGPGGGKAEARFSTMHWPIDERPGGVRIFACQHLTREAVWIPELMRHANGATRIDRVEFVAPDPRAAAEHMGRMIDQAVAGESDGAFRVPSGGERADLVFLDRALLARRHAGVALDGLPAEGPATLALRVADEAAAARALAGCRGAVAGPGVVKVPPSAASGVLLELGAG